VTTLYGQISDAYSNDTALDTRLSAAENLNGIASTLTSTVKQVRDLTTGTLLYTAVDGLRTLAAGTTLTNTVLGLRDMTAAGGSIVTAVKQSQTDVTTLYALTKQAFANDTALDVRLDAAENLNGIATTLTNTVKQVRDLTSGTGLYTAVNNMRTLVAGTTLTNTVIGLRDMTVAGGSLVTAVKQSQTDVTTLYGQVSDAYSNDTALATRLSAAENLNGIATTLTNTVKQVRDLTTGTALYTAVNSMRTLVAGTTLTNTVIGLRDMTAAGGSLVTAVKQSQTDVTTLYGQISDAYSNDTALDTRLSAAEDLNGVATTLTNTVKQVRDLSSGTALYTAVNNMRTLVAGTTLTNTVIALRDGTGTSPLITSVNALKTGAACCGTTPPGSTAWVVYGGTGASNYVDISIASCGFTNVPSVVTSLTGSSQHFLSIGQTSVYFLTATSMRVYVTSVAVAAGSINANPTTPAEYNAMLWAVAWCAFA
jgi:hypothetical protein